jgi:hypothetical protein
MRSPTRAFGEDVRVEDRRKFWSVYTVVAAAICLSLFLALLRFRTTDVADVPARAILTPAADLTTAPSTASARHPGLHALPEIPAGPPPPRRPEFFKIPGKTPPLKP